MTPIDIKRTSKQSRGDCHFNTKILAPKQTPRIFSECPHHTFITRIPFDFLKNTQYFHEIMDHIIKHMCKPDWTFAPEFRNSIQIMNGYECNGTDIFMRLRDGMFYSTRQRMNRTFHLSPNENSCTIARIKSIHYLFYIT